MKTDWAQEIVKGLHLSERVGIYVAGEVVDALRKARTDALDEAIGVSKAAGKNHVIGDVKRSRFSRLDVNTYIRGMANLIAEDLAALKDKT